MQSRRRPVARGVLPRLRAFLLPALALGGAACQEGAPRGAATQAASVASFSTLLPWGAGSGQAGLRPGQADWPADGPSALAAFPGHEAGGDGVLVLDRLHGRVLWASDKGARPLASVPPDSEDLAAGPGGVFATHSLLRARAFLFEGAAAAGEVAVDRSLRELQSLSLGPSRQVRVANAHQETLPLGSPSAPQTLPAVLHGKRKGAFLLDDGAGVDVRLDESGRPEVRVVESGGERPRVRSRWRLPEPVLSARVVGAVGDVACLRLEEGTHGARLAVTRRAVCHELRSGARVFEQALGAPGLYVPRRELAMAAAPTRLLFQRPEEKGLRLWSWTLPTAEVAR